MKVKDWARFLSLLIRPGSPSQTLRDEKNKTYLSHYISKSLAFYPKHTYPAKSLLDFLSVIVKIPPLSPIRGLGSKAGLVEQMPLAGPISKDFILMC